MKLKELISRLTMRIVHSMDNLTSDKRYSYRKDIFKEIYYTKSMFAHRERVVHIGLAGPSSKV